MLPLHDNSKFVCSCSISIIALVASYKFRNTQINVPLSVRATSRCPAKRSGNQMLMYMWDDILQFIYTYRSCQLFSAIVFWELVFLFCYLFCTFYDLSTFGFRVISWQYLGMSKQDPGIWVQEHSLLHFSILAKGPVWKLFWWSHDFNIPLLAQHSWNAQCHCRGLELEGTHYLLKWSLYLQVFSNTWVMLFRPTGDLCATC